MQIVSIFIDYMDDPLAKDSNDELTRFFSVLWDGTTDSRG